MPPVQPMLAKAVKGIPDPAKHGGLVFEPKWDGFRCLVFRDGDEVELASRNTKPLTRYFPEVVEAVLASLPERCVLDGEIFVATDDRLQFELLQERIHPADSRVRMLAERTPAGYVAFDLLALGDASLMDEPFEVRRARLVEALAGAVPPVHLTRTTTDPAEAQDWFRQFEGAGLDGVVAKPLGATYQPERAHHAQDQARADRGRGGRGLPAAQDLHARATPLLGSLLLGLYADGRLQHIGVSASFTATRRAELVEELAPLVCTDLSEHPWGGWSEWAVANPDRVPGTQSRWSAGKDLSFTPLRPERVLEVGYDHMEGSRFRHTAQFKRWRPDRDPSPAATSSSRSRSSYDLAEVLGG